MKDFCPDFARYQSLINGRYREKFARFRALLLEYQAKFNLTSITEEQEMFYKHYLDSLCGESLFPLGANVCEIGSGAGFPSVPLKIVRDDLRFTLVESTGKKCEFLRIALKELDLNGVNVVCGRAEDLAREETYREKFDLCCARAVAPMNTLAEYCLPFVKIGGKMIAYKGNAAEEVKEAEKAVRMLGGKRAEMSCFALPEGYGERSLVTVEKIAKTPEKYPRGNGKERSRPI